jgi:ribosomal protein L11 methyltransferase
LEKITMASWTELRLVVPRGLADAGSELLWELGALGVQEDYLPGEAPAPRQPWDRGSPPPEPPRVLLRGWWEADAELAQRELRAKVAAWDQVDPPSLHPVEEADWAETWKQGITRVVVGRLAVAPPWLAEPGDLVVEPGMAFGTGEHPTTRRCLEAIERLARPGGRCLDVGCGTGVLALAAARLGMQAHGLDIDPEAVRIAIENAELNRLEASFDGATLDSLPAGWDLVVANVYGEVLVKLAPELRRLTGERLVLAGILADREDRVLAALAPMTVELRQQDGDWVCLELAP